MNVNNLTQVLEEITRRVQAIGDPEQIILFGSYARGEARPESDLDLLVIKDTANFPVCTTIE